MKKITSILTSVLSAFFVLAIVSIGFTASTGAAFAKTSSPHITKITIHMWPVNANKSKVGPNVTGPCGDINLTVSDLGNGDARFTEEVSSTLGFIFSLSYTVAWANHSNNTSNSVGNSFLSPSNPWTHTDVQFTQPGLVTAVLTANDWVGGIPPLGQSCSGLANDADQIS